ncbi:MAG: HlyC/CorC family transporter [Candidatus Heimdallarchaeota archaeon]|nr:HlyC/CorC family transporter [Candidatus Heimdallarchaeota archaeon]MCK5049713.1 HlyC/CorC family transporter [Candidatus Heimdallarchaeota archaeon]
MVAIGEVMIGLLYLTILILINAFFVAAEFSFITVRKTRMKELANQGSGQAKRVIYIVDHIDEYINSAQLGITIASIALGWVAEPIMHMLLEDLFHILHVPEDLTFTLSVGIGFFFVTTLHVVLGESVPKYASIQLSEKVAMTCALPMIIITKALSPLLNIFNALNWMVLKALRIKRQHGHISALSESELRMMIDVSEEQGYIEKHEEELLYNVFEFADAAVKDVLTPRPFVVGLENTVTFNQILAIAEETGYSRFPIYEGKLDNVIGILHIKDLIRYALKPETFLLDQELREVIKSPENKLISKVLAEMKQTQTQLAVVFDEFGVVSGIITLEDIIEELVGEIDDEFDSRTPIGIKTEGDSFLVNGRVHIDELCEVLDLDIKTMGAISAGGFVVELLSRIPDEGESTIYENHLIEVLKVESHRIIMMRITRQEKEDLDIEQE